MEGTLGDGDDALRGEEGWLGIREGPGQCRGLVRNVSMKAKGGLPELGGTFAEAAKGHSLARRSTRAHSSAT